MNKQELEARVAELEAQVTASAEAAPATTTFALAAKQVRGYHVYDAPTGSGKVYLPSGRIPVAPATITIDVTFGDRAKVERRKLADMTPAEKAAHARTVADNAVKRAAQLEAELKAAQPTEPTATEQTEPTAE